MDLRLGSKPCMTSRAYRLAGRWSVGSGAHGQAVWKQGYVAAMCVSVQHLLGMGAMQWAAAAKQRQIVRRGKCPMCTLEPGGQKGAYGLTLMHAVLDASALPPASLLPG
jgi:hypothetical protein